MNENLLNEDPIIVEGELENLNRYLDQHKERNAPGGTIILHVPEGKAELYKAALMKHLTSDRMEMLVITDAPIPSSPEYREPLLYDGGAPWADMLPNPTQGWYQTKQPKPKKTKCLSHHGTGVAQLATRNQKKEARRKHR
jgi:hypothetical protein